MDNSYVPSVVSSATTTSSNVVTVSLSEAVTSNGGDLSANLANLEGLFTLKVGDTTLTGSDYTLSSADNQTLTFTIDAESNYIEKDEIVQVVYDANASTTTHNLKDGQNDFTADFTQLVDNSYVPSVVSSATTMSASVVQLTLTEDVVSNSTDLSSISDFADLGALFTLKIGSQSLTYADSGSGTFSLSKNGTSNNILNFTINTSSDHIQNVEELVQIIYNSNASDVTHNLADSSADQTPDFVYTVPVTLQLAPVGEINMSDILENSTLTFTASDILSSITDPNNDTLDASSITSLSIAATSNATVALDNSSLTGPVSDTWTFTPGDFYGEVKLSVTVSDQNSGGALSSTFETLFNVLSIDDAPIQSSSASLTSVARGQNKNISLTDLLGNITDKETTQLSQNLADNLSVVGNSVVADKGTVTFDASTSTWVYNSTSTNAANESITDSGTVTLSYVVTDGTNQISASATFTVNDVNAAPTGYIEFSDVIENAIVKFTSADILNRISDPNADPLTYSSITSLTIVDKSTGSAIPNSSLIRQDDSNNSLSTFTFSPGDFTGTVTLTAVVDDGNTNGTNTFTVDFDVLPVNDFARFNPSDGIAPVLASASLSPVDSKTINLYFTESLDSGVVLENNTFVVKDSDDNTLSYSTNRDSTDYATDATSISLLLDTAIDNTDDLKVSYSGSSIVDASSANSGAGNALASFTDVSVANARVNSPLLTDANVAVDGSTLTLNFSRSLDSTDVITDSTFNVEVSSDGSNWQSTSYSVDGDSTDFSNSNKSLTLEA